MNHLTRNETNFPESTSFRRVVSFMADTKAKPTKEDYQALKTISSNWQRWLKVIAFGGLVQLVISTLHRVIEMQIGNIEKVFLFAGIVFLSAQVEYALYLTTSRLHRLSGSQYIQARRIQVLAVCVMVFGFMANIIYLSGLSQNTVFAWWYHLYIIYIQNLGILFFPLTFKAMVLDDPARKMAREKLELWHETRRLLFDVDVNNIDRLRFELDTNGDTIATDELKRIEGKVRREERSAIKAQQEEIHVWPNIRPTYGDSLPTPTHQAETEGETRTDQDETDQETETEWETDRLCLACNKPLHGKRINAKYCDDTCKNRFNNPKRYENTPNTPSLDIVASREGDHQELFLFPNI